MDVYQILLNKKTGVEKYIDEIGNADEVELLEYDFVPVFEKLRQMESAMQRFVTRVDKGEVRSTKTYLEFVEVLSE